MPIDLGLLNIATNVGSSLFNAHSQHVANATNRAWDMYWYNRQRKDSLADFNMQNEYNSPARQMERLKAANLNPHLVYGNGADAGMGAPVRSSNVSNTPSKPPVFDGGNAISSYYDTEVKKAQIDNLKAQNTVAIQDALLRASQVIATNASTDSTRANTATSQFDLGLKQELKETSVEAAKASVQKMQAETTSTLDENERRAAMQAPTMLKAIEEILTMRAQRANTQMEREAILGRIDNLRKDATLKELDINLKKLGIQPNDALWQRILAQLINQGGIPGTGDINNPDLNKKTPTGLSPFLDFNRLFKK